MSFAQILIDLRNESNLSQMQLAEKIGVSQSTIAKLEIGRNEATASTLAKLAAFFDVSADYLLGLSDDLDAPLSSAALDLPADERELLNLYRQLNYEGRQRLIARAEVMIEDAQSLHVKPKKHRA